MTRTIRIEVELSKGRRQLVDEFPLTKVEQLALLNAKSPLSSALVEGAGFEFPPRAVMVYCDGTLLWRRECHSRGPTSYRGVGNQRNSASSPPRRGSGRRTRAQLRADRAAANREYAEYRNAVREAQRESAEFVESCVSELLECASWDAPTLPCEPASPDTDQAAAVAPYPCRTFGRTSIQKGLPYSRTTWDEYVSWDGDADRDQGMTPRGSHSVDFSTGEVVWAQDKHLPLQVCPPVAIDDDDD